MKGIVKGNEIGKKNLTPFIYCWKGVLVNCKQKDNLFKNDYSCKYNFIFRFYVYTKVM